MKKQGSTVDKDFQKKDRFTRMCVAITLGVLMLWLPSYIQTDIDIVNISKGVVMFFGFMFLVFGLFRLFDIVTGKPLPIRESVEEALKEE